uniref:Uncharacterized protein n=1 Tax=Pyxicephalus adspersus TaxID=30357 RepID=A0AAV3ADC7_PYXAD|nr:TPA: hypothetical protein GDO54_014318 [Pyxicephalus adspersus]
MLTGSRLFFMSEETGKSVFSQKPGLSELFHSLGTKSNFHAMYRSYITLPMKMAENSIIQEDWVRMPREVMERTQKTPQLQNRRKKIGR